ncbi:MAG: nitrogenase component 1 [Elusimicrobia bacterium]|nr:nitrogenase component 1 [Elusimicrobiota bacterium]
MAERVRHITAGPAALAEAARLLGLARTGQAWRLSALCVEDGRSARLELSAAGRRLVLELGPGKTSHRLGRAFAARLGRRGLTRLRRLVERDPDSFAETLAEGSGEQRLKFPYVGAPIGLQEAGWRNFFCDQDFEVLMEAPEATFNKTVTVEYADLECFYARPGISFREWNFLDWPDQCVVPDGAGEKAFVAAELEERDMVLGTGGKADDLVAEVRRLASAGNFVVVTHLCTPIVMGEDFQRLARRCEVEVGATAVGWSQKDRDRRDNFGDYFRSLLGRRGFFSGPGDPGAVNLFHFPEACREEDLRPLLQETGLRVNVCAFPRVDFPSLQGLPRARWQVFCAKPSYPDKLREILERSGRPVLAVRAPYGVAGTRECLAAVADAAGRGRRFARAWQRRLREFQPGFDELRREAARYRLAFVVSQASLPRLLQLRYGHGAPLAAMVQELGFGVDLLCYDRHGAAPELPAGLAGARVTMFRSPWELQRALREGEFQAVCSDIRFDWRVSRAGKGRFSSRDFEMGLAGAARTGARLLGACRNPFFRRYAPQLAKLPRRLHA